METSTYVTTLIAVAVLLAALIFYKKRAATSTCPAVGALPKSETGVAVPVPCPAGYEGTQYQLCDNGVWGKPDQRNCQPRKPCSGSGVLPAAVSGQTATAACPSGYTGTQKATCLNGEYSPIDTSGCVPVRCEANMGFPRASYGEKVAVACLTGGGLQTATCGKDGFFEDIDRSACALACPADSGFPVTPIGGRAHAACPTGGGTRHRLCKADGTWDAEDVGECPPGTTAGITGMTGTVQASGQGSGAGLSIPSDSIWGQVFVVDVIRSRAIMAMLRAGTGRLMLVTCGASDTRMEPKVTMLLCSTSGRQITVQNEDNTQTTFSVEDKTSDLYIRTPGALLGNNIYKRYTPVDPQGVAWVTLKGGTTIVLLFVPETSPDQLSLIFVSSRGQEKIKVSARLTYTVLQRDTTPWHVVLRGSTGEKVDILRSAGGTLDFISEASRATFLPYT